MLYFLLFQTLFAVQIVSSKDVIYSEGELQLHGNLIELSNPFRSNGVLRFEVHGANVSSVSHNNQSHYHFWTVEMADKTTIKVVKLHPWDVKVNEYQLVWSGSGKPDLDREVCFHYGYNNASWFSTYIEKEPHWPMDTKKTIPKGQSFLTQKYDETSNFGPIVEYLFFNSDGFLLDLDVHRSWFLRRDSNNGNGQLCVSVANECPYSDPGERMPSENYSMKLNILAGSDLHSLYHHSVINVQYFPAPHSIPHADLFTHPIWSVADYAQSQVNQTSVLLYAHDIQKHNFSVSRLDIGEHWQKHNGDFEFDVDRFSNATKMTHELKEMTMKTSIMVSPLLSKDSKHFNEGKAFFVKSSSNMSANVIDFSMHNASEWYVNHLQAIKQLYGIDSFQFESSHLLENSGDLHFSAERVQKCPNLINRHFVEAISEIDSLVEVTAGFHGQTYPAFVRMFTQKNLSLSEALKSLVVTALTLSTAGYSFIVPNMVHNSNTSDIPDEEWYIRWIQATTFLPAMHISIPPWRYNDKTVEITRKFVHLHAEHAYEIIQLAYNVHNGEPVIRPMWYVAPNEPKAVTISDQFMLGNDLLVAPVLYKGHFERNVFLPTGKWSDSHGKNYTGPSEITVKVPLEELAYFTRQK